MSISIEAIQKILGIEEKVYLTPEEMARTLTVTFYPFRNGHVSQEVEEFSQRLKTALLSAGVKIIPYELALMTVPLPKIIKRTFRIFLNNFISRIQSVLGFEEIRERVPLEALVYLAHRRKVRVGVSVIALGENRSGNLPVDHTVSFRETSIITIVDMPHGVNKDSDFHAHFDAAMRLFAHHMTNIVIAVDKEKWILYNFNASHPIYPLHENFEKNVLHALIPKVASPIRPHRFSEFLIYPKQFDPNDSPFRETIRDMIESGTLLEKSGLYPPGKSIAELPFRNNFYRWIGKIHLDHRSGMSYGFLARQLPSSLAPIISLAEAKVRLGNIFSPEQDYFVNGTNLYIIVHIPEGDFCLRVPDVWVMTQRSGANKTRMDPARDLIIMGLVNGRMILRTPRGLKLKSDYKPSFDTKVILAHAVGNALAASVLNHIEPGHPFASRLVSDGMAIVHFHGYLKKEYIPDGWHVHGIDNPHVACSTAQAAIYALDGKMKVLMESISGGEKYFGDIHIEPHHGTNITFSSLDELGKFFISKDDVAKLGNSYLHLYNE